MKNLVVLLAVASAPNLGCKGKKAGAPPAGSAASGSGGGTAADPVASTPAAPPDPARALVATTTDAVAKLLPPPGAGDDARIGQAIDAIAEIGRATAREGWDPAAVVAAVGKDRKALFMWVRDRTALVPYRGSLRGAVGVMMDRVGNSLDRALLLADLLRQAGLDVRLATGPLEPDAIAKLAATWSARARPPLPAPTVYDEAALARFVAGLGIDAAAFAATTAKLDAAADQLGKAARARIAAQTAAIDKLVPAAAAAPAVDPSVFAEHWWVQVQDEAGWSDLDPTLPDANPGEPLANATETLTPEELADDRRHTMVVRVIGEVWHGDAREETTLVEHAFAPSLFWGQRIVVTTSPLDLPDDDTLLAAPDPAAAATAALVAQTEWIPVIQIGERPVVKMSVTDGGELYDVSAPDANTTRLARAVQRATERGVGAATGILDTLPDEPGGEVAPQPVIADRDAFTAQWIELELRAPGEPARVVRRQVFDALDGADRAGATPVKLTSAARLERALALCGQTELLPLFARIPEAFVTDRAVKALVAARPALVELAAHRGNVVPKPLRDRLAGTPPMPGAVYALALARFEWSGVADRVYVDRLGLLAEHRRTVTTGKDVRWRNAYDIMANDLGVWPAPGTDSRATRIAQGVADTVAEAFVLICPGGPIGCVRGPNTSDEYTASGATWKVLAAGSPPDSLQLPSAARALAAADLAAGYAIVVPPGGAATWWRVHPSTGETLGMGSLGGNATVEQIVLALTVGGLGSTACVIGSHSSNQMIDCLAAVGFGAVGAYAGIEYTKRRIMTWAFTIVASLLGIRAASE